MRSLMCGILKLKQTSEYNNKNRLIGTENKWVVARGRGLGLVKYMLQIKSYEHLII